MNDTLVLIKGYKLPSEEVWVDEHNMYEVYDRITLCIDGADGKEMIIIGIDEEGLVVNTIN